MDIMTAYERITRTTDTENKGRPIMTGNLIFEELRRDFLASRIVENLSRDKTIQKGIDRIYSFNDTNRYKLFLSVLFDQNHRVMKGKNPNAGFLIGFTRDQLDAILNEIKAALIAMDRDHITIDLRNQSFMNSIKAFTGNAYRSNHDAFSELKNVLLSTDKVVIFKEFSECTLRSRKCAMTRAIIKINDDAHMRNVKPLSDILFLDYAGFLQKAWDHIGSYIRVMI